MKCIVGDKYACTIRVTNFSPHNLLNSLHNLSVVNNNFFLSIKVLYIFLADILPTKFTDLPHYMDNNKRMPIYLVIQLYLLTISYIIN